MIVNNMKVLKKLENQPWSAWKKMLQEKLLESGSIPDSDKRLDKPFKESAYCTKLPRSDMGLFGICPKTELFELVICNYCGNKYKLSAFADHLKLRHSVDNISSPKSNNNVIVDEFIDKKGTTKKTKEKIVKPKENDDGFDKTELNVELTVEYIESSNKLPLESEDCTKVKEINLILDKDLQISDDTSTEENITNKENMCIVEPEPVEEPNGTVSNDSISTKDSSPEEDSELANIQPVDNIKPSDPSKSPSELSTVSYTSTEIVWDPSFDLKSFDVNKDDFKRLTPEFPKVYYDLICTDFHKDNIKALTLAHSKPPPPVKTKSVEVSLNKKNVDSAAVDLSVNRKTECPTNNALVDDNSSCRNTENDKSNKTEGVKIDDKLVKRITTERPRLSLPVSIKTPPITYSVLSKLHNKALTALTPGKISFNENIADVIKNKLVQNKKNGHVLRENSSAQQNLQKNDEQLESKEATLDDTDVYMWCFGFRKLGGTLYANPKVSCLYDSSKEKKVPISRKKKHVVNQPSLINRDKKQISDISIDYVQNKMDKNLMKTIQANTKKLPLISNKQKGQLLMANNSKRTKSIQHKVLCNQDLNSNQTVLCKRLSNSINGVVPSKKKRPDGMMNIVGSVFATNEHNIPVVLELSNNMFEKKIIAASTQFTPSSADLSCGGTIQSGMELINGNIIHSGDAIRIGAPRIHYFTTSPALSNNPPNVQQIILQNQGIIVKDKQSIMQFMS